MKHSMIGRGLALAGFLALHFIVPKAAVAQPSGGWAKEGRQDLLKTVMLEAFKKSLGPGGEFISSANDFAIDPLVAASTTTGTTKDKMDAWLLALGQSGLSAAWPPYGLILTGGKITVGGAIYSTEELIAALQDQQNQAILFGRGTGGFLDRLNNVMSDVPFIDLAVLKEKGINASNLGDRVQSEEELKRYWDIYRAQLRDLFGKEKADETANANWPRLQKIWRLQRAATVVSEVTERLDAAMDQALKAPAGGAEQTPPGGPTPDSPTAPTPEPPPQGAHLVLERTTTSPPDLMKLDAVWKEANRAGNSGSAAYELYGNTARYKWTVPEYLDATPRPATIQGSAKAVKNGYGHDTRLAFSISMGGDAKFDAKAPSVSGVAESAGGAAQNAATVNVLAPALTPGSRATIKVSVQYAFSVTYHYVSATSPKR